MNLITAQELNREMNQTFSFMVYEDKHAEDFLEKHPDMKKTTMPNCMNLFQDYLLANDLCEEVVE